MKQIEYILDIDRRNSGGSPLSQIERQIVHSVLAGMPYADFLLLSKQLRKNSPIFYIYDSMNDDERKRYYSPILKEEYKPLFPKTSSLDCLLNWISERKRGKLTYAKTILTKNFRGYSDNQQKKILKVFLRQTSGYRRFAYSKLYANWDEKMIPHVLQSWYEFHDEMCGWLIIRVFPTDIVKEMSRELATPGNLYLLCKRLGKDMPFYPEKDLFSEHISIVGYLDAISHTQYSITSSEAEGLIYRIVSVVMYGLSSDHEFCGKFPGQIRELPDCTEATTKSYFRITGDLTKLNDVKDTMVFLCKLGHLDVVKDFLQWNASIIEHYNRLKILKDDYGSPCLEDTLALLLYLFPDKYRHLLDYSEWLEYSWLSSRFHILLKKRKRRDVEYAINVNFDGIRKLSAKDFSDTPLRQLHDETSDNEVDIITF